MQSSTVARTKRTRTAGQAPRAIFDAIQNGLSTDDPPLLIRDQNGKIIAGIKLEAQELTPMLMHLRGWCFGRLDLTLLLDGEQTYVESRSSARRDVADAFKLTPDRAIGFEIRREHPPGGSYALRWASLTNKADSAVFVLGIIDAGIKESPELIKLLKDRSYAELIRKLPGASPEVETLLASISIERDNFLSLADFYSHMARAVLAKPNVADDKRKLAKFLMDLAISTGRRLQLDAYVAHLENLTALKDNDELVRAVATIVGEAKTEPRILWTAADMMFRAGRPDVARLLIGQLFHVAPSFADTRPDATVIWDTIVQIHDQANQAGHKKLGTLGKWLASTGLAVPTVAEAVDRDDRPNRFDAWHHELLRILDGRDAALLIDGQHYCAQVKKEFFDTAAALRDYLHHEWRSGRDAIASFDNTYVRAQLRARGVDTTAEPLLVLFFRYEQEFELAPNPLFDPTLYPDHAVDGVSGSKWLHYVFGGWRLHPNPSRYFDVDFFLTRLHRNSGTDGWPPIVRYLAKHPRSDANRRLHSAYYLDKYGAHLQGRAPLSHYVADGAYLGYTPNPFFEPAGVPLEARLAYLRLS